jgi:stage V sporulation protein B
VLTIDFGSSDGGASAAVTDEGSAKEKREEVSRQAGRGGIAVAGAKIYFILAGLVQQFALPRVLGLDGYGALSSALSAAGITYNPIVTTSIQGVSRAVAGAPPDKAPIVLRRVLMLHFAVAFFGALALFLVSPLIGDALTAPHVVPGLQILSLVLLFYGAYAPLIGALNGQRRFVWQAGFDVLAATLRTVALVAGAYFFARNGDRLAGVEGASWGFVASAAAVLVAALAVVGIGKAGSSPGTGRAHAAFISRLLLGQVLLNLLLQADLNLLRRFSADAAKVAGLPVTAADSLVGAYRATQLFSFLPYQLLIAITFVLFPMLASAKRDADHEGVARYVRNGLRIALVLAGAMISVTSGLAGPLLRLVFGAEAAALGDGALEVLSLGFGAFAIFGLLSAILNGLGREGASVGVTFVAFALVVGVSFLTVRGAPFSSDLLVKTAVATSAGIVLATGWAAYLVWKTAGALIPLASLLRTMGSVAVAVAVGRMLPIDKPLLVVPAAALVGVVYLALMILSRELGKADLAMVSQVFKKRA